MNRHHVFEPFLDQKLEDTTFEKLQKRDAGSIWCIQESI